MFLSALYSGMEGTSNSFQNFEDGLIVNGVRSRKKISENLCCPVCSCTMRANELDNHFAVELERLNKLSFGGNKRKISNSSPQNVPVAGSSTSEVYENIDPEVFKGPGSDVFRKIRNNRMRRLRGRDRRRPASPQGECPVCSERLPLSRLQRHALRCLRRTGASAASDEEIPDTSSDDASIDVENDDPASSMATYTWGEEERIRSTDLQTPEERACLGTQLRRASNDTALVVDGDDDIEMYGPPQYSPSRIEATCRDEAAESRLVAGDSDNDESDARRPSAPVGVGAGKTNGIVEASAETRIQALKAKLRDLERRLKAGHEIKCLICLGPYVAPAVSIQCWHVHCEMCWLDSLRAKKICPQCNAITTVQHLRRIYM